MLTLFGSNFLDALAAYYDPLFSFVLLHGLLYAVEACLRAVVKTNWLLFVHHLCWVLLIVIATDARSVFSVRCQHLPCLAMPGCACMLRLDTARAVLVQQLSCDAVGPPARARVTLSTFCDA